MKIIVTGSSSYEKEQDGIVVESRIYSPPPVETPEGKVWNGVLGKFIDESEANYPFEVDENDTVFGEGHLAKWIAGDELAASLEEEDEDFDDEGEEDGDKEWRESALEVALNYLNDAKNDEIKPNVFSKGWAVKKGKESGEKKQKKGETEKKKVDEKPTKTAQDSLYEALVADELPKDKTLAEHDKERHPDGFNPETDSCKFRDELKKETETDKGDEVDVNRGREEDIETAEKEEQDSAGDAHKKKQLDIILDTNPMTDDYHTGIRELSDIKTFAEACEDDPPANPDITEELVEDANNSGKIVVYSSYPIRNGTFVTPSRMMAKDYAGSGQVYSKEVPLEDVAWISGDEGQYAKVAESEERKPEPVPEPEQDKPADTSKVYEGLSKKKAEEYRNRMAKKRPDLDADLILTELGKIKDKKIQGDAFAWVMKGAVRLPEDLYKVEQARELATKAKRDPMQWDTPQACINELMGQGHKISEKPITVEELKKNPLMSDYRDEGFGVETFQVEDSREGQQLMRQVLNTHWGKDANPWCLLHGDGEGNLSDGINGEYDAWKFWQHYNALPKRVAFKDGKLLAFMATESQDDKSQDIYDEEEAVDELANDEKMQELIRADIGKEAQNKYGVTTIHFKFWVREKHDEELKKKISEIKRKRNIGKLPEEWWDRIDRPHRGIPIGETEVPNDKLHRIGEGEILKGELVVPQDQPMHIGTDGKPGYRLWEGGILKKEIRDNGDVVTFSKDEEGNVVPEEITCSDGSSYKYRNYGILIQAAQKVDDRERNYAFYQNGDFAWVNIGFAELHYKDGKPSFLTSDLPIFEKDKMYMVSEIPNSNNEHLKRVLEILENAAKDGKELYKKGNSLFSSCIPDEGEAKTTQDELVSALMGDVVVEDAALPTKKTLQEHDKERHKGHFDPSTQTCKFREQMMVETESDKADLVDSDVSGKGQETDSGSSNQPMVTPEEDKEYMEAVERGDMETAAKMVRDVAGRAYPNTMVVGRDKNPEIVFHGSPTYGFTKFRSTNEMNFGIHLGDEDAAKERLQNIDELVGEDKPEGKQGIYKLYADITNPIVLPDVFLGIGDLGAYILNSRGEDSSFIDPDGILVGGTKPLSKEVFKDNAELENLKKVLNAVFGDGEYDGKKGFFEAKKYLQPAYVSYLQSLGYDGVIYDNQVENKGSNSWVALNPSQIKSADPVTWDDKGHVVPLSKRFDSGDDIRGDVSSGEKDDSARLDEEYMSAIDDDDTEKAKRVLRDAAAIAMPDTRVVDEDGKPKIVWHGTGAEFTQFKEKEVAPKTRFIMDIGIHFGDEKLAEKYARVPVDGRDGLGSGDRGTGSKMMPCFLDLKNPIDLRYGSKIDDAFANRMREIAGIGTRSKAWILKDVEPTELVQKAIEKDARAVRKAFDDFGYDGAVYKIANMAGAEAWMAFKPSQIKSAEIVTTGDDGEVIPVSRRFDGGNDIRGDVSGGTSSSVRHSISDDGEEFGDSFYGEVYPDRKQSYSSEFGKDDAEDGEKASEAYRENFTKDGKYKSPFEGGKFNRAFLERAREGKGAETGDVWDDESRAAAEAAGRVLSGMLGGVTFELSDKPYENSENSMTMKSRTIEITPEEEEEYSEAVEDHDDDWANDIVKNVAKKWGALVDGEGNPIKLYHGSDSGGIICASDRINLFTTVSPRTAKVFGKGRSDSSVQCFYGRMENPLTIDAKRENWDGINVPKELSSYIEEEYATTDELADGARKAGFDGLIIKNIHEGSLEVTDDYVFLNAEGNVKLADPITFDYYGNVIPISERFNGYNSEVRYFRNNSGKVVGEYNRATNKITLYPGAKIKDVVHEYSHGLWQFAEQEAKAGRDGLQKKLHQIAHAAPEKVKEAVGRSYYDQDPNVVLEECFTHEMARRSEKNKAFADAIKTASGKKWYKKAWGAIKDTWKGLASKLGFNKADTSRIDDMTSGEAADFILTQMAQGKKFGDVNPDDTPDGGGKGETRKSFIGEIGAENLGIGHLDEAKKMEEEGVNRKEIWQKTGWWKGKDGKWKIEIPDVMLNSDSKLLEAYRNFPSPHHLYERKEKIRKGIVTSSNEQEKMILSKQYQEAQRAYDEAFQTMKRKQEEGSTESEVYSLQRLTDVIEDTELFDAYPELKKAFVTLESMTNYNGLCNGRGKLIQISGYLPNLEEFKATLTHEIQHLIQGIEGFGQGTNIEEAGWDDYWKHSGEVESRNVSKRLSMSRKDRLETPPWDTEDVPEEKQIVRH